VKMVITKAYGRLNFLLEQLDDTERDSAVRDGGSHTWPVLQRPNQNQGNERG
jgi:hypothetical protein